MTFKRLTIITSLVVASALTVRGAPAPHLAHLSDDLARHLGLGTTARVRVIVRGDQSTIDEIAARHHLQELIHPPSKDALDRIPIVRMTVVGDDVE